MSTDPDELVTDEDGGDAIHPDATTFRVDTDIPPDKGDAGKGGPGLEDAEGEET